MEVDGGGAQVQPGVVLGDAAVGHSPVAAGQPGQGALDHGSVPAVGGLEGRVGGAGPMRPLQRVVRVQMESAPVGGGGAVGPEWAAAAGRAEGDTPGAAGLAGECRPAGGALIGRGSPAGQVTAPATSSTVKSSRMNPPGTAGRSGQGLTTGMWPAACRAASASPVP